MSQKKRKPLDPDPELWAALENGPGLTAVLKDFYDRVYEDPRLAPFFVHVTKTRVRSKQFAFLRQILTGENLYFGDRPRNAHHWMVISDELFDYREDLLADCFRRYGLEEPLIERIRTIDEVFRKQIVKDVPRTRAWKGQRLPLTGYESLVLLAGSLCDECHIELPEGYEASYHKRSGRLFCAKCMESKSEDDMDLPMTGTT